MEKDRLIIIDGNSLVNRAFYALPPMNTKEGTPTNAVFGFVKMLVGLVEKYKPTHLAVAFDLPKPTFRHKRYDGYKATRKSMPDDLRVQMPLLKNILSKMHIQILEQEGYEADDILGTVAKRFEGHTFVVTGDGDSLQLISDTTTVLVTKKGISELLELTPQNMVEQKGMTPAQVIDYKALCGDTSDNIPGVKGIGEKTATGLLQEYHTLDGVYKNLESIKGSTKDKLVQGKEMAYLSYELATIDTNVPMETPKDACVLVFPFGAGVRAEFENLGFKTLLKMERIFAPSEGVMESQKCAAVVCQHAQIKDQEGLQQVVRSLGDKVGVHIETNTVHLSDGSTEYTMAISDDLFGSLSLATVMGCLKETLENPQQQIIGYDCKQLMREADKYGVGVTAYFDVRLAEYILDYPLSQNECANYFESLGTGEDCLATACVARAQEQTVMLQKAGQDKLFFEIELPLVQVLFAMEKTGMRVDTGVLSNLGKQYSQKLLELSAAVQKLAGQEFNLNSPKQLGKVLFEDMKLPYPFKNSKTLSTAVDVLSEVQDESGIIDLILQYREIAKLNSTYIEGLLRLATDGVVHSDFRQMATVTGRLSSTEPN
ncbi:MAG: DNA polymerase, partial [Firmicutes bacterium]|nr:DNA polymerase [Bacillota bacterium]